MVVRRAALLVVGGKFDERNLAGIGKWWSEGHDGVIVITCEGEGARLVLVDLDQLGPPRAVGDTDDGGRELLILNLPQGAEGVTAEHAVQAAKALGATPAQCQEVLDEALRGRP